MNNLFPRGERVGYDVAGATQTLGGFTVPYR